MKVLIVSHIFPPSNAIGAVRVGKFAKYLHEHGHDVRVLSTEKTGLPSTLPVEIPAERVLYTPSIDVNWLALKLGGRFTEEYYKGRARMPRAIGILGRAYRTVVNFPDGQIGWLPFALRRSRALLADWRPDLIFASGMPFTSLIVAARLSRRLGVPWVAELRDLWVDNHYYDQPRWRRALEERLERSVLSSASGLVTVSEPLAAVLRQKYGKPTAVVLNGYDPEDFPEEVGRPVSSPGPIRILYTGLLYHQRRDPSPLFAALQSVGADREQFRVQFFGRVLPEVMLLAEKYGVQDLVEAHEAVSFQDSIRLQTEADVLLLLLWNSPAERGVYTGKLFEYLGARRPILLIGLESGVAAGLIRDRKAGLISNDPEMIAGQLRAWLGEKRENGAIPRLPASTAEGLLRAEQFAGLEAFLEKRLTEPRRIPRKRETRVLHVITDLQTGGAERMLTSLMTASWPAGADFRVVSLTPGGEFRSGLEEAGLWVRDLGLRRGLPNPIALWRLVRTIRDYKPDIVQSWMYHADLVAALGLLLSGRRRKTRLFWGVRCSNMDTGRYSWTLRFVIDACARMSHIPDAIIANSEVGRRHHVKIGYLPRRAHVVDNGVDTELFRPDESAREKVRRELGLEPEAPVLALVARRDPMKDHDTFFRALERVPNAYALLIGLGTESFPDMPRVLKLGERHDVPRLLGACDLLVSSSAFGEGFSNAIVEGMACGLPAVATDVGDARRIVGDAGLIVPPRDPVAMADAIGTLLSGSDEERRRRSALARRRVVERFSLAAAIKRFGELYEKAA
ncbi:MAG: glycosyltransferase [Alphaproteobacteria bacterium]